MIDKLEALDQQLLLYINSLHTDFFDSFMYHVSEVWVWIPVYLFLLFLVKRKYGWKTFWIYFGGICLSVLLSDRISVELFKEVFQRYRPCHNLDLQDMVHTVKKCGGKFSFVSSHATNYFGISVLSLLFLRNKRASVLLLLWAGLIGFSRIYLGVHYPADVMCGALLGTSIAFFVYWVCGQIARRMHVSLGANHMDE